MTTTEQDPGQSPEPVTPTEAWRRAYGEKLQEAIAALTDAARLARPRLQRTEDGQWVDDPTSIGEQGDWAEFVTLALAGAAANFGGVDAILAGRSGSWEAAGVRQVLESTVGPGEHALWEHRTEPLEITLLVDELLADRSEAWVQYDDAQRELARRFEEAEAAEPQIDYSRYVWDYDRDTSGQWAPRDPEGPAWSLEALRASLVADGVDPDEVDELQERLLETATGVHIPKSADALAELRRLEDERDARTGVDLDDQLEQQRLSEWTAYGEALRTRIETAAAAIPGLTVPVSVRVDVDTYRSPSARSGDLGLGLTLAERLIETAVMDTPTPEDLPGTPLDRLTSKEA